MTDIEKERDDWENACAHWEEVALEALAREAKLRDELQSAIQALALPTDYTALKEALKQVKREALLEAADNLGFGKMAEFKLRRMAEEIK